MQNESCLGTVCVGKIDKLLCLYESFLDIVFFFFFYLSVTIYFEQFNSADVLIIAVVLYHDYI